LHVCAQFLDFSGASTKSVSQGFFNAYSSARIDKHHLPSKFFEGLIDKEDLGSLEPNASQEVQKGLNEAHN
jgi:hypothetical protein